MINDAQWNKYIKEKAKKTIINNPIKHVKKEIKKESDE